MSHMTSLTNIFARLISYHTYGWTLAIVKDKYKEGTVESFHYLFHRDMTDAEKGIEPTA